MTDNIQTHLDKNELTSGAFIDLRKAFGTVFHDILLKEIVSGLPQGSILGLLLFLIYINDLHSCLKYYKAYHFTNDTNLSLSDKSQKILATIMNHDLRKLSVWLRANKPFLYAEKTEHVVFQK